MTRFLMMTLAAMSVSISAIALDLQSAKRQGMVGELPSGYIGSVNGSATSLVAEVNAKRKAAYLDISQQNGQPLNVVEALAAKKLYDKLSAGEYYQSDAGEWKKK